MARSRSDRKSLYVGKRPKRFRWMKGLLYLLLAALLCAGGLLGSVYYQVSKEADSRIARGAIEKIIFSESPVYYEDGETPIGVFFEKTHRRYIEYERIPKAFIKAIIAAEDHGFFDHPGFDLKAIVRAFLVNLKAGRVVQGGSTISQQTAKNIFKRERRSYKAKLKELFQALLLEQKYSKEEILELYSNQFFVSGFGRGLEIAARYFFDKSASDLDLVECAFIAGSVKGPNRYNPFTKRSEAEREKAMKAAEARKDYVLQRMLELRFITRDQFEAAEAREVPFQEGQVTYRLNVILDYVREQLQSPYFQEILAEEGIENIATSGMRVFTSINREIQQGAIQSLRKHLPRIDVRLQGYPIPKLQERFRNLMPTLPGRNHDLPFLARITHVDRDPESPSIVVSWEGGGGVIDLQGLHEIGEAWVQSRRGIWAGLDSKDIPRFLELFRPGDWVPVRFFQNGEGGEERRLCLTHIPELEGGVVVLQNGRLRAMAGGFYNRYFNRAVDAKRQLGSTFKPIVYTAALQLKWNILDTLLNRRGLFQFEKTAYVPKPDHEPRSEEVSMAWAGVKSENLATVWLLYHLTDHLTLHEFREVVRRVGLHRRDYESYQDYVERIRDRHGVLVDQNALMQAAFEASKKAVESDVIFEGYEAALHNLRSLHFEVSEEAVDPSEPQERRIYRLNYERLRVLDREMTRSAERIRDALRQSPANVPDSALKRFRIGRDLRGRWRVVFPGPFFPEIDPSLRPLTRGDLEARPDLLHPGRVWVDGLIPSRVLELLQRTTLRTYRELLTRKRYELDLLYRIRDFRVLVNLHYVREVARQMGVSTPLDPVLSFPLGANAISIAESARAYQAMMNGNAYPLGKDQDLSVHMIPIIERIEDREGQTIWEYKPQPKRVLSERVSGMVSEILRLVVASGTGRRAEDAIRLGVDVSGTSMELSVPAFGKTGTANRYTNSSFVGFLPGPGTESGMLDLDPGFVLAAYVGYDDNRPMKGEHVTVYGSSGALPVWIETSNAIVNSRAYKDKLQIADLAFEMKPGAMTGHPDLRPVYISTLTGLPVGLEHRSKARETTLILSDVDVEDGTVRFNRRFEPIQGAASYDAEAHSE